MARALRIEYPGAFYHVTSRGNERKAIFRSQRDREVFLSYLESAVERYSAVIHVFCLMDNHYHLLLETPAGNLSKIMQHINGAYTNYFNRKRNRAGHLFQGRYKAILVDADTYAKELSRYIHLNPVRAGMVETPETFKWSSCRYYTIEKNAPAWIKRDFILAYFAKKPAIARRRYQDFLQAVMGKEYESPLVDLAHSIILGGQEFVDDIKKRFLKKKPRDRELPALRSLSMGPGLDDIESVVSEALPSNPKLARQIKLYLSHRYSGMKLREIGQRFGISESGVTQASGRVRATINENKKLRRIVKSIEKKLGL